MGVGRRCDRQGLQSLGTGSAGVKPLEVRGPNFGGLGWFLVRSGALEAFHSPENIPVSV